jgi:hypothetical protein
MSQFTILDLRFWTTQALTLNRNPLFTSIFAAKVMRHASKKSFHSQSPLFIKKEGFGGSATRPQM